MTVARVLMMVSAGVVLLLGTLHLAYTFYGTKLWPREPDLIASMQRTTLHITNEMTVWNAWIGFNASHSMAAMLFGLVFGYLAFAQPEVLFRSAFLLLVGLAMVGGLAVLAKLYWFSIPFAGVSLALFCYVSSVVVSRLR
ncbi:MAG TPA: hypothetical protein VNA21_00795 [Steroidobacteraceae bacterium]|nr:hypothetical protein [Steroidobacteraceae bacterium]